VFWRTHAGEGNACESIYLNAFSLIANEFSFATIPVLVCILGLSAIMSGLSGFGFSAIGALCLWLLPPKSLDTGGLFRRQGRRMDRASENRAVLAPHETCGGLASRIRA